MNTAATFAFWTTTLNLPDLRVVHLRQDLPDDPLRFTLIPLQEVGCCPHCGSLSETVHRRHRSDPITDLPIGDRAVVLFLSMPQYKCLRCKRYFTPHCEALAPGTHATQRFLAHISRLLQFSDIANVADLYRVPERTLARWYYDHLDRQQRQPSTVPCQPIRSIGIDELSLKKNTGNSLL